MYSNIIYIYNNILINLSIYQCIFFITYIILPSVFFYGKILTVMDRRKGTKFKHFKFTVTVSVVPLIITDSNILIYKKKKFLKISI